MCNDDVVLLYVKCARYRLRAISRHGLTCMLAVHRNVFVSWGKGALRRPLRLQARWPHAFENRSSTSLCEETRSAPAAARRLCAPVARACGAARSAGSVLHCHRSPSGPHASTQANCLTAELSDGRTAEALIVSVNQLLTKRSPNAVAAAAAESVGPESQGA